MNVYSTGYRADRIAEIKIGQIWRDKRDHRTVPADRTLEVIAFRVSHVILRNTKTNRKSSILDERLVKEYELI